MSKAFSAIPYLILICAGSIQAETKSVFLPDRAFVVFQATALDPEPRAAEDIYNLLSQEPKDSPGGGKGKIVQTATKDFTLSCVERESRMKSWICQLAFAASERVSTDSSKEEARLLVNDLEAAALFAEFNSDGEEFLFQTAQLEIRLTPTMSAVQFVKAGKGEPPPSISTELKSRQTVPRQSNSN